MMPWIIEELGKLCETEGVYDLEAFKRSLNGLKKTKVLGVQGLDLKFNWNEGSRDSTFKRVGSRFISKMNMNMIV